ncbi:MAG: GumC family protein [Pirellula sp.]|jgi:succinoglycan biosynthesis transport protein ExoP
MNSFITNPAVKSILRGILVWAPLWILTTIIFGALGVFYAFFLKTDTYIASQALLVRDEANGAVMRLGRFQSQTEMKAAQETILEMAKSHQVVREALVAVGEPPQIMNWLFPVSFSGEYPSKELVEETANQAIQVHAPKGTEFGTTEIIYLDIKSNSTDHARRLNKALCDALESRLQQVRRARADGVILELVSARNSRRQALTEATKQLEETERAAGSDLTDLRGLTETVGGNSSSRSELEQIKNEIRQSETSRQALLSDRDMLIKASQDPQGFLVAPGSVLNAHPGLKRMREGLADSQIQGAHILGKFTADHPSAIASNSAQAAIASQFSNELKAAITTVDAELALADIKLQRLETQKVKAEARLAAIAEGRAAYANLVADVKSKTTLLETAERELAGAQAARDASISTSLLTRLDAPIVSDRPTGPGRTTLSGLSAIAGLVFGLGIVFAITPIDMGPTYGRRSRDKVTGRRSADLSFPNEFSTPGNYEPRDSFAPPTDSTRVANHPIEHPVSIDRTKSATNSAMELLAESDSKNPEDLLAQIMEKSDTGYQRAKMNIQREIQPRNPSGDNLNGEPKSSQAVDDNRPPSINRSDANRDRITTDVDNAFRELARLKSLKSDNYGEEQSIDEKINEIKAILEAMGYPSNTEILKKNGYIRPRPSQS